MPSADPSRSSHYIRPRSHLSNSDLARERWVSCHPVQSDCNFAWAVLSPHSCRLGCCWVECGHVAYCWATGTFATREPLALEDSSRDRCNHSCLRELYSEICRQHLRTLGPNSANTTAVMVVVCHLVGSRRALSASQSVLCSLDPTHRSS